MDGGAKPRAGHLTLVEVVLAAAVLGGILIFVVLPAIREATIRRNEEGAIRDLKAIHRAQELYASYRTQPWAGYGRLVFGTLADLGRMGEVAPEIAAGRSGGYSFSLILGLKSVPTDEGIRPWYEAHARPLSPAAGRRHFYVDASAGVFRAGTALGPHATSGIPRVRSRLGAPASSADSPIE